MTDKRRPLVYVASPLGFTEPTMTFYRQVLLGRLMAANFECLDPWTGEGGGENNEKLLNRADGVFAVLDGADIDSGTAAEVGWAAARGLPVVGWRSDVRRAGERPDVMVNLQVQYFIERTGGTIKSDLNEAVAKLAELLLGTTASPSYSSAN